MSTAKTRSFTSDHKCRGGCGKSATFQYDTKHEKLSADRFYMVHPWLCTPCSRPDEVLTLDHREITTVLTNEDGLWFAEGDPSIAASTLKAGPGFMAWAGAFPSGVRLVVTARVELPDGGDV